MIDFLRIDPDLVTAAAEASPDTAVNPANFRRWVKALPAKEKEAWLLRAVDDPQLAIGSGLVAAYRRLHSTVERPKRTVAKL